MRPITAVVIWLAILLAILIATLSPSWEQVCITGQELEADGTLTTWPISCTTP